jgi:hypothetical protein
VNGTGVYSTGFARGSPHSILLVFSQFYIEHDLRKNKIAVPLYIYIYIYMVFDIMVKISLARQI